MNGHPKFRIGHLKIVDHLLIGVASDMLLRQAVDLEPSRVEAVACNSWSQISDLLIHDKINAAFMTIPLAIDMFAKGLDIRILMYTHRGGSIIVKNKDLPIRKIGDMKGHSVLIPSELSVQNMLFHRLLSSAGLVPGHRPEKNADVFFEAVSPFLMPRMLKHDKDGDIAGFAVAEPYGSQAVIEDLAVPICNTGKLWENHPCCAFVIKNSVIDEAPDAVARLTFLFKETAAKLSRQMDKILSSIGPPFLNQPLQVISRLICESDLTFNPDLLIPDPEQIAVIQDYMADTMNVIDHKIDIRQLIDPSFITAAQ